MNLSLAKSTLKLDDIVNWYRISHWLAGSVWKFDLTLRSMVCCQSKWHISLFQHWIWSTTGFSLLFNSNYHNFPPTLKVLACLFMGVFHRLFMKLKLGNGVEKWNAVYKRWQRVSSKFSLIINSAYSQDFSRKCQTFSSLFIFGSQWKWMVKIISGQPVLLKSWFYLKKCIWFDIVG